MTAYGPKYARSAARTAWGNVNSCKQVVPGVYAVDTWGHGGYIVAVGPNEPFDLAPELRIDKFFCTGWSWAGVPLVTFYQFEEDCDWAVLMHYHPELLIVESAKGTFGEASHLTPEYVRGVVERWNPEMLRPLTPA